MKLHDGEVEIDAQLVGRLLNDQFPRLAGLPITEVHSTGIGSGRTAWTGVALAPQALPRLSPHLSLRVPEPVEKGRPTHSYPLVWAIYRWIDGQPDADALWTTSVSGQGPRAVRCRAAPGRF